MLADFFRINFPYGIIKDSSNGWACFNREYMPLGWNKAEQPSINHGGAFAHLPIYTRYKGLTEAKLLKLAQGTVRRDDNGKINMVFFYNDRTNPQSEPEHWNKYFERIQLLSTCEVKE